MLWIIDYYALALLENKKYNLSVVVSFSFEITSSQILCVCPKVATPHGEGIHLLLFEDRVVIELDFINFLVVDYFLGRLDFLIFMIW